MMGSGVGELSASAMFEQIDSNLDASSQELLSSHSVMITPFTTRAEQPPNWVTLMIVIEWFNIFLSQGYWLG